MGDRQFDIYRVTADAVPVNFEAGTLTEVQGRTNSFATPGTCLSNWARTQVTCSLRTR